MIPGEFIYQHKKEMEILIQEEILKFGVGSIINQIEDAKNVIMSYVPEGLIREQELNYLDGLLFGLKFREVIVIDKETGEIYDLR